MDRRVQFTLDGNGDFPDDRILLKGAKFYKKVNMYIAWYTGTKDNTEIADYTGIWPIIEGEILVSTLEWMREELGYAIENLIRAYALDDTNTYYTEVHIFLDTIRDRTSDGLIISHPDYKDGVLLLETAGILTDSVEVDRLLALGGHER